LIDLSVCPNGAAIWRRLLLNAVGIASSPTGWCPLTAAMSEYEAHS